MLTGRESGLAGVGLFVVLAGCHHAAPAATAPAPVAASATPPPAPKRCEALDEGCAATKETTARIADSGGALTTPDGGTYAKEATVMIATFPTAALAVTVTAQPPEKEKKKAAQERDSGVAVLSKRLEVVMPKHKIVWQKP